MIAQGFADTNLFLYAASKDPADQAKKRIARELLATEDIGLSAQVLQEFIAAASGKKRLGIDEEETTGIVAELLAFPVAPITAELVMVALEIKKRQQISYWDAAIVAAALALECAVIYSEDLSDGQDYGGVVVRNPFSG
jgi:predicted nucleic acid-binding protein